MIKQMHLPWIVALQRIGNLLFPLMALISLLLLKVTPELVSPTAQLVFLAVVIVLFGLPHGALDPWLAERIGLRNTRNWILIFTSGYLFLTALVVMFWLWLPALSLLIFLMISAWHFSEDWAQSLDRPMRLCAGALLLLMPIGFQTEAVMLIFEQISGVNGVSLATLLALSPWLLSFAMLILVGGAALKQKWYVSLEFLTLLALAYFTSPLVYFTLYFCFLHSQRHLLGIFTTTAPEHHLRLLRMMITYTLATLLLIAGLWFFWSALPIDTLILKLIFIGLAAVTVPHMILIAVARARCP